MTAAKIDLIIEQGATFPKAFRLYHYNENNPPTFRGAAKDLTGYSARMQVREAPGAEPILVEFSSDDGGIFMDPATGVIQLHLSAADSAKLNFVDGVYDLLLIKDGIVARIIEGKMTLSKGVTQVAEDE